MLRVNVYINNHEVKLNLLLCFCMATDLSGLSYVLHRDAGVEDKVDLCPVLHLSMHSSINSSTYPVVTVLYSAFSNIVAT